MATDYTALAYHYGVLPMGNSRDYAVGPGPDGQPLLHKADCPIVRAQADEGEPVMTMMDCQRHHRDLDVARCHCLEDA